MIGFFILLFVMIGVWVLLLGVADTSEISKNWPKYRCDPSVMPFASFYGHDTTENFNFCLNGIINMEMGGALSPILQMLAVFLGTLTTLITVANNIRLEMATFMGGINTIFQNFTDRFLQLSDNVRNSAQRIRMLMGRVYGSFFTIIYMSMSAMTALTNFTDTFLFKFLDTFCFDPDTKILVVGKGYIPVKDVEVDDVLSNGITVTAKLSFLADGQPMVSLPGGITVSTNHYIEHNGKWVRSDEHPDAVSAGVWNGGVERPLICFNTHNHRIPIGEYTFLDYDETSKADQETMDWVETRLNALATKKNRNYEYNTLVDPSTAIRLKSGEYANACSVTLGTELSTGKVIGVIRKKAREVCVLQSGDYVTPGLLVWDPHQKVWFRAGDRYGIQYDNLKRDYFHFIVSPTANIELTKGILVRDYFEVHSPETEQFYAKAIEDASCVLAE